MILLDTNIISELMKKTPNPQVTAWIDKQETYTLYISAITIAEIVYGINSLPNSQRKRSLDISFNKLIVETFKYRILNFDEKAANFYGKVMSHRKALGKPMSILDGQIAAIALTQGARLATRNIRDFTNCELELINPFD